MPNDPFCKDSFLLRRPDEAPDLYQQNVFWDDIFLIGNFNEIDYEAVVLELIRRQYRSWEMNASYTWSEATGNGEDFFQELGDDPTSAREPVRFPVLRPASRGQVQRDDDHSVGYPLRHVGDLAVGPALLVDAPEQLLRHRAAGHREFRHHQLAPAQTYVTQDGTAEGAVRNSERNISYWNVDLKATKELRLGKNMNLQLSIEVFNALNDGTYQIYNPSPFVSRGVQINGRNEAIRRFGRRWQLGEAQLLIPSSITIRTKSRLRAALPFEARIGSRIECARMRIYNTLTRKVEELEPLEAGHVRMYTCGPTVYDYAHIGNFRSYVWEDLLRRSLELHGFRVTQVMNITDIEDKIIKRMIDDGVTLDRGDGALHPGLLRGHRHAADRARRTLPAGHRTPRGDDRAGRAAPRATA